MENLDEQYMDLALDLAESGRGTASPNPMVGAVVVKDGKVVGKGFHKKPGTPHGEAIALQKAGEKAAGATLYVNLEPCCHTDKLTPPCADAVIKSKVARVVVGMIDPNPKVSGRGIKKIRDAGIEVEVGVLQARCEEINRAFAKQITTGMPFVTMKVAQTLDGKIATASGESKWITGPDARQRGHVLRSRADAIIVGIGTVLRDDPSLTARLEGEKARDPHRIILDSMLRIPLDAKVLNQQSKSKTYIATTLAAPTQKMRELKKKGAELLIIEEADGRVSLPVLMAELAKLGMTEVLVEGGATVNAEFLRAGMADRAAFFIAPKIMGGIDSKSSIGGASPQWLSEAVELSDIEFSKVGSDILVEGRIKREVLPQAEEAEGGEPGEPGAAKPKRRRRRRKKAGEQGGE